MLIRTAVRAIVRSSAGLSSIRNRLLFPGLRMASSVSHDISGDFSYGTGCLIGRDSIVFVPQATQLRFGEDVYVGRQVELGPRERIEVADFTSIQDRCLLVGDVKVGRYCIISLNVLMTSGRHYYDLQPHWLLRDQDAHVLGNPDLAASHSRPIRIEDDCWLGVNSVIAPGVTVGKGCVIGANAVVTHDVPPYVVVVGSPARIIKNRLHFAPPKRIDANVEADLPYFYSGFGVSKRERAHAVASLGLLCGGEFSVALDAAGSDHIVLQAKAADGNPCKVRMGGQTQDLTLEYQPVHFALSGASSWKLDFTVENSRERWPLHVKKAWVE